MSEAKVSTRGLLWNWFALLLLLALTCGVAEVNLGAANTAIAMGIAGAKILLVAVFFMQLRHSSRLTWVFAVAGFLWLTIMIVLTMGDYFSRNGFAKGQGGNPHFSAIPVETRNP